MLARWTRFLPRRWRRLPSIDPGLWARTLTAYPFLLALDASRLHHLQQLCQHFLLEKEFHGAHGFRVTDRVALAVAAQACLPLIDMAPLRVRDPWSALDWYDDFVGIVMQPAEVLVPREVADVGGVIHRYTEVLAGEAMDRGPIMLSWREVARAGDQARHGTNLVVHEFLHKFDMRGGHLGDMADGAPPLPPRFMGLNDPRLAREHWRQTMQDAYDTFHEAVEMADRFGGPSPWLDRYAAHSPAEFFAVTGEAYFVNRPRFEADFPVLTSLYDGFFRTRLNRDAEGP